jgi:Bacterial Ig-like domain
MGKRLRHLLAAMAAVMLAALPGCGSGSGTQLPVPAVVSTVPVDAAAGVHLDAAISAAFNQEMNSSTVNDSTFVLSDPSGALVVGLVTYDSASFTATFTPRPAGPQYRVHGRHLIGSHEHRRHALAKGLYWSFSTGTTP